MIVAVLAFVPFIQGGCGGGGGSSSSPAAPLALADVTASVATDSLELFEALSEADANTMAGSSTPDIGTASIGLDSLLSESRDSMLLNSIAAAIGSATVLNTADTVQAAGSYSDYPGIACVGGGTQTTSISWDGPDFPVDCSQMRNVSATVTMTNCVTGSETANGTTTVTLPGSSCDFLNSNPTAMTVTMDMSVDAQGVVVDFNNLTMGISGIVWDQTDIVSLAVVLSGTVAIGQDSVSFDTFQLNYTSVDPLQGDLMLSMDGYIRTPCLDGWVHISATDILWSDQAPCPVSGTYNISGASGEAEVTFNGADIEISLDGQLIGTYQSCTGSLSCL
jgi:hypothetical protein